MSPLRPPASDTGKIVLGFGNDAPLYSDKRRRPPDRRRVSLRWLSGTVLTAITSLTLMGGALHAAFDGRQLLSTPASTLDGLRGDGAAAAITKGDRVISVVALEPARERVLQVSTVTRLGDQEVIRKKPFAYASAPLAIVPDRKVDFPEFNPLTVFSTNADDQEIVAGSDVIYSANVEGEVTIRNEPFPLQTASYDVKSEISAYEAELAVAEIAEDLSKGDVMTAALPYLDPGRFALENAITIETPDPAITVTAENVTVISPDDGSLINAGPSAFAEEVVVVARSQKVSAALRDLDVTEASAADFAAALSATLGTDALKPGTRLWIVSERAPDAQQAILRRLSVYAEGEHLASVATDDGGAVVAAIEPAPIPAVQQTEEDDGPVATVARANLPTVYNGIFRAALSQGLSVDHAKRIMNTVAFDVDFRATIEPRDELEVFFSLDDPEAGPNEETEIIYVGLTVQGVKRRYYRFRASDDGSVDYYDEEGKSAKKFLLRNPVPNSRFNSPFGPRRHPISRRVKMHWGADFSAPRGTPILAAGNGVVEKAGWSSGYGKQTIIRHANGYKTSYSHQHRFANGIKEGATVRQGQIIGQVGSTGYSTGPHLHYEVIVNGNKVNPMKIRLPKGRVLSGSELASFKRERDRIDALLERSRTPTSLASL